MSVTWGKRVIAIEGADGPRPAGTSHGFAVKSDTGRIVGTLIVHKAYLGVVDWLREACEAKAAEHSSLRSDPTPDGEKLSAVAPALEVLDSGPADGLRFHVLIDGKHLFSAKTREIAEAVGAHVIAASPFAAVEFAPNGCEWAGCKDVKLAGLKFCSLHKLARDVRRRRGALMEPEHREAIRRNGIAVEGPAEVKRNYCCWNCGAGGLETVDGAQIGGMPGINYKLCRGCGWSRAITKRPQRPRRKRGAR